MFEGLKINVKKPKENFEQQIEKEYVNVCKKLKELYVQIERLNKDYKENILGELVEMLVEEEMCSSREKEAKMKSIEQKYNVCFKSEQKGLVSSASHYLYNENVIKDLIINCKKRSSITVYHKNKQMCDLQVIKIRRKLLGVIQELHNEEEKKGQLIIDILDEIIKNYMKIAEMQIALQIVN